MARAFPQSQPRDYAQEPQQGEWQALRGELVALLDQVEHQVARTSRQEQGYPGLAERMRELRYQVGDIEPDDRHREALRSVKRAVDRFSDRDDAAYEAPVRGQGYPPNPRDSLQSAIHEIRSRQMAMSAPAAPQRASEPSHFDELARAVDGVSGRLERLEGELKTQARSQSGNVKEIAEQVGQLSHVVELLAGAVGETGQVKRLEGQIASLATLVQQGPQVDLSALTRRLDDVSATVGRLADLQVQYASKVEGPAALKDGMASIEQGVRHIYDRIDAIEKHHALSPDTVDRLTDEMARFTEAMHHSVQPEALVELVDRLDARIARIDSRHGDVGGLKADVQDLRNTVIEAVEPRFAALELQIEALSERFADRAPDLSIGQLEAQVRQLVARMDQTGEQLTGIARMQVQPEPMPDLESLADLVAIRTSQAVAHSGTMGPGGLSDEGLNEIEARMSRVVKAASARTEATEDIDGVRKSINEVNERLARMEASLSVRARQDDRAESVAVVTPAAPLPLAEAPTGRSDAMPANPADDAPLTDKPFPDMGPVRAALQAKNGPRMRHPGLDGEAPARPAAATPAAGPTDMPPGFDPAKVERPPRPQSSFDVQPPEAFVQDPETLPRPVAPEAAPAARAARVATQAAPAAPASANTFIAAARRAAQRQQPESDKPAKAAKAARPDSRSEAKSVTKSGAGSLIARALGSFQAGRTSGDGAAEVAPAKAPKGRRKPAAATPAHIQSTPDHEAARIEPQSAPASPSIDAIGDQSAQPALTEAVPESFLRRHSKVILLGVSVVVLSLLTLNLVNQRLSGDRAAPAKDATPARTGALASPLPAKPAEDLATLPDAPRVVPVVDTLATASIDPAAAKGFVPATAIPEMPKAFTASLATAPASPAARAAERVAELPPLAETVAPLPDLMPPAPSPVRVELPPAGVGPEPLRQAAANGDPRAQFEVAAIYTEGRAVGEDLKAAAVWYERSAAQGFAPAQYRLGNLYENGRGVEKDLDQARLWYQRAAEAGNRMSMHNLAALYAGGEFGKQEFATAAEWFEQAADRGLKDSQFNLGMLYARGLGVPQDLEKSYKWFSIAARNGDADAAKARDDVARSLDADAVGRLNAEVAAWKPASIDLAANFAPIGTWSATFDPGEAIANQDVVKSVQMALSFLGYDVGTPDGVAGPKTAEAIRSFERATGMSESGAINPRLLAVLGSQPV